MKNPKVFLSKKAIMNRPSCTTRIKIIELLKDNPQNANQISKQLNVNYKTASQHLSALEKNKLVQPSENKHIKTYTLSKKLKENYDMIEALIASIASKGPNLPGLK